MSCLSSTIFAVMCPLHRGPAAPHPGRGSPCPSVPLMPRVLRGHHAPSPPARPPRLRRHLCVICVEPRECTFFKRFPSSEISLYFCLNVA